MKTDNELIDDFNISQGGTPTLQADLWFYESSWDMIMPVWCKAQKWYVEEFGLLTSTFEISSIGIKIKANHHSAFEFGWLLFGTLEVRDVYRAVVEFVKWYYTKFKNENIGE